MTPALRLATRSDVPSIATFLPALGGPRFPERYPGRTLADFLTCKYFENPLGDAVPGIAVDGDRVVGLVAATPKALWMDNETYPVYELGDFLTDDRYRGRGIFSTLVEIVCEEIAHRQAVLAYVRPNENSFPILMRHGAFAEPRQIDGRRFVFPSAVLARKVAASTAWLGRMGLDQAALRWAVARPDPELQVERIDRFGPAHDRLWEDARQEYRLAIERRSTYLNWRYADSPTPFLLWEARRGAEAAGFLCAFVSPSSRTGHIADLFTRPGDEVASAALVGACFHAMADEGIGSIYCWRIHGHEQSAPDRVQLRACPLSNGPPLHLAVRVLDPAFSGLPPSPWHLSMGDFDGV